MSPEPKAPSLWMRRAFLLAEVERLEAISRAELVRLDLAHGCEGSAARSYEQGGLAVLHALRVRFGLPLDPDDASPPSRVV